MVQSGRRKNGKSLFIVLLSAIIVTVCLWIYFLKSNDISHPVLFDSDCYMRLIRAQQLYNTGSWLDNTIYRSNVPYGETLHWSRLLDILLLAGAYVGSFFVPFSTALFWWGVLISPVLLICSIFALYWAVRALVDQEAAIWSGLIFFGQIIALFSYEFGRPDHHSLLLFLFILMIGFILRVLDTDERRYTYVGGLIAAVAIWVSMEMLTFVVLVCSTMLILWIWKDKQFLKATQDFLLSISLGTVVFVLMEHSFRKITVIEYDKVSLVHVVLFFALWGTVRFITPQLRQDKSRRFVGAVLGPMLVLAGLALVFPDLAKGPYGMVDPLVVTVWLSKIYEAMPIYNNEAAMSMLLVTLFLILPYILFPFFKLNKVEAHWVFLNLSILFFGGLTFYQCRFIPYAQVLMVFPLLFVLNFSFAKIKQMQNPLKKSLMRILVIITLTFGPILTTIGLISVFGTADNSRTLPAPPQHILNQFLDQRNESQTILTGIYFGAQMIYETKHQVIATPYHRSSGILYLHHVMAAATNEEAHALLRERKVDLIILYPDDPKSPEYHLISEQKNDDIFYNRLVDKRYPIWLRPVALPENIETGWLVFEVEQ
ncbi:MAG: rane protein required for N-linked glycosylation-like protein [Firmicutes bacterium]|nr:rane protein required for N-linked glycosylation-like protein [Bacillota bacterium]